MADKRIVAVYVINDEDNSGPDLEKFLKSAPAGTRYTIHNLVEEDFDIDRNLHVLYLAPALGGSSG